MNKTALFSFLSVGLVAAVSLVPVTVLAVQGDPIPGVDVSVEQSPSGIKVQDVQTNSSGMFVIGHLQPGQYLVKITPPKAKPGATNNYNSVKSGVAISSDTNGGTVVTFTVGLFVAGKDTPAKPIGVTIGSKGGKISGTVTETVPDEGFFHRLGRGISNVFTSVVNRILHPFQGSSTSTTPTPTVSPTRSPTPASTPTRTTTPKPLVSVQVQLPSIPTATPTSSPSGGSNSSPTSSQTPTPTATPTPNTDPTLISVYPKSVSVGNQVAINGTYFTVGRNVKQVSAVLLNGTSVAFSTIDGQTLFITANLNPGVYNVSVVTTTGQTLTLEGALTIQ